MTGYFLDDDAGATYNPIPPVRVLDTRSSVGLSGKFVSLQPRTFQVTGLHGIPTEATAISGNLTVTNQTKGGFVSLTPLPTSAPTTSTLNFPVGDTRANGITVRLSPTGTLSAVYRGSPGATTELILDVSGYYVQDLNGLRFFALNPGRRIDTRTGSPVGIFHGNVPQTVAFEGHEGAPLGAAAITGNLTITSQTAGGYVSITPDPTVTPATSTINFPVGDTRANGVTVPMNGAGDMSFIYRAGSANRTQVILDVTGYFK